MLAWFDIGIRGLTADVVSPTYLGVDVIEGRLALGLAIAALVAVLFARVGRSSSRRWAAGIVLAAGLGIVAASGTIVLTGPDRFEREAVAELRAVAGPQADADLLANIAKLIETRIRPGVWLAMAGGAGVGLGGVMTLAWTRRVGAFTDAGPTLVGTGG